MAPPRLFRGVRRPSLALLTVLTGCSSWRVETRPLPQLLAHEQPQRLRLRGQDSTYLELRDPRLVGDSVLGTVEGVSAGLPLNTVTEVRTRRPNALKTVGLVALILGAAVGIGAATTGGVEGRLY
jgi:hypothetical protein